MRSNRWQDSDSFEVPQTPLIDIIFILIVFFLVATTFYTEERDLEVNLPEGTEGDAIEQERESFVVNVRQSGVIVVNNRLLSFDELEEELIAWAEAGRNDVEIRGDTGTQHGRIMEVMNLCKRHGLANLAITQRIVREE